MSQMEHNKGKLIPFELTEEIAKEYVIAKEGQDSFEDCYLSYLEQVEHDYNWYDESLARVGDKWYKVEFEIERGELYGFADVVTNEDGTISFNTYHYNGGAHWTEVVERALSNV